MATMRDCPVCGKPEFEGDVCPQCNTDLGPLTRFAEVEREVAAALRARDEELQRGVAAAHRGQRLQWRLLVAGFIMGALVVAGATFAMRPGRSPIVTEAATATPNLPSPPAFSAPDSRPPVEAPPASYLVRAGDTFSTIARRSYGRASLWRAVWEVNRDRHPSPDRLPIGAEVVLPRITLDPRVVSR